MKRLIINVIMLLTVMTTLGANAYTFRVCYNGSQDTTDTDVPTTITMHSHIAGGDCWTPLLPDVTVDKGSYQEITTDPNMTKINNLCHPYPEAVNGKSVRPTSGSWPWPPLKPMGEGQTWQIYKTKPVEQARPAMPHETIQMPTFSIEWFADIQDGLNDCALTASTKSATRSSETTPTTSPERKIKAAGILPYSINPETNQAQVLIAKGPTKHTCVLGLFNCSMDKWADFGGSVEAKDFAHHANKDDAIKETAAREMHEETMGFFTRTLGKDARSKEETDKAVAFWTSKMREENRVRTKAGYDYWLVEIPYIANQTEELRQLHNIMYDKSGWGSSISTPWFGGAYFLWKIDSDIEKSDFRWISVDDLLTQFDTTASASQAPFMIKDPDNSQQSLELYSRFVTSLREGRKVLERINSTAKRIATQHRRTGPQTPVQQLIPAEKKAFEEMLNNVAEIKTNLIKSFDGYKAALANKNKESADDMSQQISEQLMAANQLMKKISDAVGKNTALGTLITKRLSPEIRKSLQTKAEEKPSMIMNALQDMLFNITRGINKAIKIIRWPVAGYYMTEYWDEINANPQPAIVASAGVAGAIGLLDGLASMLKRGPELTLKPEEILAPFQLEIAQAEQAEQEMLKALEQKK